MRIKTICAIVVLAALAPGLGQAQISPFSDDLKLTGGDLDALGAAVDPMLDDPNAAPGTVAEWTNADSGTSGSVKVLRILDLGSFQSCKKIQYDIRLADAGEPKQFVIDYCQVEDGTWKSYP